MKQKTGRKLLGALLALAMVIGLMPGMSLTAYAYDGNPYASLVNQTTDVTFDDKTWYIIKDNSTAVDAGTVTLLAKECVAQSRYCEGENFVEYSSNPTVKTVVDNWYTGNITADAKKAVSGGGMFLLTKEEAEAITNAEVRKDASKANWWLCSPGSKTFGSHSSALYVHGVSGIVNPIGDYVFNTCGVRPALKLDLSSVIFSSESNTFSLKSSHTHSFNYTATGATITATCTADGCTLPPSTDGGSDHVASLTIAANGGTYDGTTAYGATITDASSIQGDAKVEYQKKTDGSYGTATETAPKDAGDYKASITVGGATASVEYTIAQADSTANAPTGLTATYGQTLADVSLEGKNPEGNTPGTWTWADSTQSVGNVVDPAATFKANFTPTSSNYKTVENVDVSVTVGKADPTAPTGLTVTYGQTLANVTLPDGWTWADSTQSVGDLVDPTATFKANFAGDDNHNAASNVDVTVTVGKANAVPATVTANSRTYDGTEKPLVTVTGEATGGTMQYALGTKDAATQPYTTSIPTATNAGTYYVWYKAAGDENHLDSEAACVEATIKPAPEPAKRVAITSVSKPADVTYNGKAQRPSVTVKAGSKVLEAGSDYAVTYKNNTDVGIATVTVTGKGGYEGTKSVTFKVRPAAITSVSKPADVTYTGKAVKPKVTVKSGSKVLKAGTDYTVSYKSNTDAGTATVTARGKGNYAGTKSVAFKVKPANITSVSRPADATRTGRAIKPSVTVKSGSKVLKAGTDYTVSYKNNVEVGTATVTAKGRGNYAGTKSATFRIKAAAKPQPAKEPVAACSAYAVGLGWLSASGGDACGTTGQFRRVESVSLRLADAPVAGGIEYRVHVQDQGWQRSWSRDGQRAGRAGGGKRVEAVRIRLTGKMAEQYDVYYRVHSQTYGWLAWARNGEAAGTAARLKRLESVQVAIVRKGSKAPGRTYKGVTSKQARAFIGG